MPRIQLPDTIPHALSKIAQGSRKATVVLLQILTFAPRIDPSNEQKGILYFLILDNLEIYGEDIFNFYNNLCRKNLVHMLALLRAWQLAGITTTDLLQLLQTNNHNYIPELYHYVKTFVPDFDPEERARIRIAKLKGEAS